MKINFATTSLLVFLVASALYLDQTEAIKKKIARLLAGALLLKPKLKLLPLPIPVKFLLYLIKIKLFYYTDFGCHCTKK